MTLGPVTCAQAGTLVIHFRIVVRGVRRTGPLSFVDGASQIHANAGARGDTAPAWRNGLPLPGQDAPSPRATHHHCAPSGAEAVPVRCAGPPQPSFVAGWQASCSACVTAFHRSAHRIRRSRHHDSARAALFLPVLAPCPHAGVSCDSPPALPRCEEDRAGWLRPGRGLILPVLRWRIDAGSMRRPAPIAGNRGSSLARANRDGNPS